MVGLVENALEEIKENMNPDRIIIESRYAYLQLGRSIDANTHSGSAFPATLALRIRELEPKGFKLDGVVTVIDCVNFRGYEDTSPSAKVSLLSAISPRINF
jgi:G3E family GTPase